jgi:hypothetical protein
LLLTLPNDFASICVPWALMLSQSLLFLAFLLLQLFYCCWFLGVTSIARVLLSAVITITTDIDVTSTIDMVIPTFVLSLLLLVSLMLLASLLLMC